MAGKLVTTQGDVTMPNPPLAWKVAGWYGLDRFLLPYIGAP